MLLENYIKNRRKLLIELNNNYKQRLLTNKKIRIINNELKNWDKVLLYKEE